MTLNIGICSEFGSFCADGEAAERFREARVDPFVGTAESIVLDFAGVRNANTSFCNALVANFVIRHGPDALAQLRFTNCRGHVKTLLCAALDLGVANAGRGSALV
jgi:hypothetical protein